MIIEQAKEVLKTEADAILKLIDRIDGDFERMVDMVCKSSGRVIVAGIGKSGIIGKKFVATFNSTGTRALFLHPVEAAHGDLGMVCPDDIFLALSNSGETDELNLLIPSIRNIGCTVVAFTGNRHSTLGKSSDIVIDVAVEKEACPLGLAPTTSTTALLAMGDALAAALIRRKGFKSSDFKKFHPGGALGQRLSRNVREFMLSHEIPVISEKSSMAEAIEIMDRVSLGVVLATKPNRTLVGIVTDGDIRRMIARRQPLLDMDVSDTMTKNPKRTYPDTPAYDALNLMETHEITVLPVTDRQDVVVGVIHLHDILGKGSFTFNGS